MEGTREKILGDIDAWLEDFNTPNALWVVGIPGSGKSTIASSLVSRLMKRGRMGSSFAFKRGDIMLSDPAAVWRTIAHDLARYDTSFASILVETLKRGKVDPGRPDITSHFESLIMEPMTKRHKHSLPHDIPIIVIDALDECGSNPSQAGQRKALLDTIVHWSRLPGTFKLIVTGRDERVPISIRSSCKQIELSTGAEVSMDATQDVRRFFAQRFAEIGGPSLYDWPGEKILDTLTTRAAGLFIWAETVTRFVEQGLPDEQLEHVLDGKLGEEDNVTKLYRQILELIFREANGRMLNVLNQVLTTIVLAKIPLHVDDLSSFILQPKASVTFILDKLSSVISVGHDFRIRINHLSFAEFMCDPHRCPQRFYIDRFKGSHDMSMACFRLMKDAKDGLKFNICNLETSHLPNRNVHDLPERIARNIRHPLLYSCRFWAAHIRDTPTDLEENISLIADIRNFFQSRFLYWLEIMSVTEELAAANIALLAVAGWIQVSKLSTETTAEAQYYNYRCWM
jgi:NACHT domain